MTRTRRRFATAGAMVVALLASAAIARALGEGDAGDDGGAKRRASATAPAPLENRKAIASLAIYPPSIRLKGAADRQGFLVRGDLRRRARRPTSRSRCARSVADPSLRAPRRRLRCRRRTARPSCTSSRPTLGRGPD
jgi:hypothetical protein